MPYTNIPKNLWGRADRLVKRLTRRGHSKDSAVAIAYSALVGQKEAWSTAQVNDLPDSAFLYISPGGQKDQSGKTTPRSLRHFPYRDASGKIDLPHLRNAIARIPQAGIPASEKARLQAKARRLLDAERANAILKAANYSATAGQTIIGALGRGSDGRFVRAGGPNLSNLSPIARANQKKTGKKAKAQPSASSISKAGEGINGQALVAFAGGGSLSESDGASLAAKGLVDRNRDGSFKLSSAGRSLLRASARNDPRGMQDALATARDRIAKAGDAQVKRETVAQQRAARQAETARRRQERGTQRQQKAGERAAKAEQRKALQRQKVTNRIEETQSKLEAEGLSEARKLELTNKLEELQAQLATLKEGHTGAMVAFYLPSDVAKRLVTAAIQGNVDDVDVTPVAEMHLTLAYLGDVDSIENFRIPLQTALADFARNEAPVTGKINGIGRFDAVEGDSTSAVYASFDAPVLPEFRQRLIGAIESTGLQISRKHGFTPHITLAYLPTSEAALDIQAPLDEFTVGAVTLAWGDERAEFQLSGQPEQGGMVVIKQANGQYRWITYSSNSFEDTDREIITQKALEEDIARTDRDGNYGPFRWWHCGDYTFKEAGNWESIDPGPGLDLGDCDFSAMHGRILIESGTFRHPLIGQRMKEKAPHLQVSLGLVHPPDEPAAGMYEHVRRFERSALPRGRAANLFTGVSVATPATAKESNMNAVKLAALKTLLGDDYEAVAAVLKGAEATEAQATEAGVRFKESKAGEAPPKEGEQASAVEANVAAAKEAPSAGGPPAPPPDAASAEGEPTPEGEGDVTFIGDMTPDEFMQLMVSAMSQVMQPMMDAMTKQAEAATDAVTKEAKVHTDGMATLAAALKQMGDKLKELEGDAPTGGFRASSDDKTIVNPLPVLKQTEDDLSKLAGFFVKG